MRAFALDKSSLSIGRVSRYDDLFDLYCTALIIGCFSEVQLAIRSVGICGSDLKLYKYGKCGRFTLTKPMVAGHEASGVVSKLGKGVAHLKVGKQTYRNLIKI